MLSITSTIPLAGLGSCGQVITNGMEKVEKKVAMILCAFMGIYTGTKNILSVVRIFQYFFDLLCLVEFANGPAAKGHSWDTWIRLLRPV